MKFLKSLSVLLCVLCFACSNVEQAETTKMEARENVEVKSEVFAVEGGYGYAIYLDDKRFINQPHIPGIQGLKPFATKYKAQKAANLVIDKINTNIMPPTISVIELKAVGAL